MPGLLVPDPVGPVEGLVRCGELRLRAELRERLRAARSVQEVRHRSLPRPQDRVHHVAAEPVLKRPGPHAVVQELRDPLGRSLEVGPFAVLPQRLVHERRQVYPEPLAVLEQGVQQPCRGPAQPVGVRGATRHDADTHEPHHGVHAVGNREQRPEHAVRWFVPRGPGPVVFFDGLTHLRGLAVQARVDRSYSTLQLRELAHQVRGQVRLAQPCGSLKRGRLVCAQAHLLREPPAQPFQALDLLLQGAQPLVEGHGLQPPRPLLQGAFAVLLVEEPGVHQARPQDPLVALPHRVQPHPVSVANAHEGVQQGAVPAHREVPLVVAHDRDQHGLRQLQELGVEPAHERRRPLHQVGHLVHEGVLKVRFAACLRRAPLDLRSDLRPASVAVRQHVRPSRDLLVVPGVRPPQGVGAGAELAVPVGEPSGPHARELESDHVLVHQGHHPPDRPREPKVVAGPPHGLGEAQGRDHAGQEFRQDLRRRTARHGLPREHVLPRRRAPALEGIHGHPLAAREAHGRRRGPARDVEGHVSRRPPDLALHVGLPSRHPFGQHGQASWRGPTADRRGGKPLCAQRVLQGLLQLQPGRPDEPRGQLLGPDFQKHVRHGQPPAATGTPSPPAGAHTPPPPVARASGTGRSATPARSR
ncbi:hypothetical protein HRbin32_01464 [bacterium HR32]|nr:hypothetical protein HRbin32_01464 [bacterium HR32]